MKASRDDPFSRPLLVGVALLSLGASAVHFAVMQQHFNEYFLFGLFFSVVAWLQAAWALGVVIAPSRWLLLAGGMGNLLVIGIWLVSRTFGLPIGPESGEPESAAFADILTTAFEAAVVVFAFALAWRPSMLNGLRRATGLALTVAISAFVMPLTTSAIAFAPEGHGEAHAAEHTAEGREPAEEDPHAAEGVTPNPVIAGAELEGGGRVQFVVEPTELETQVHVTFFDEGGGELAVSDASLIATQGGQSHTVPLERLGPGHFFGATTLAHDELPLAIEASAGARELVARVLVDLP